MKTLQIGPMLLAAILILSTGAAAGPESGNLLRNGSFEVGWCHEIGRRTKGFDSAFPDPGWITDEAAFHGRYALKLKPMPRQVADLSFNSNQFYTLPVKLAANKKYVLGLWARSTGGPNKISITPMLPENRGTSLGVSASANLNDTDWTRLRVTVTGANKPVYLSISGSNVLIDAVEFLPEESALGDTAARETRYIPAAAIEAGLDDPTVGRIHYQEEPPVAFDVRLYNYTGQAKSGTLAYELINQDKVIILQSELAPVQLAAGGAASARLNLPALPNGLYALKYWVKGSEAGWGEITFSVMPRPDPARPAAIGLLTTISPEVVALMKRGGFGYYGNLTDLYLRLQEIYNIEKKSLPDRTELIRMLTDSGITVALCINPWWWRKSAEPPWHPPLPARHPSPGPDRESYYDAVDQFARMYAPYIKIWWIQDELEGHAHPHEFLPILVKTEEIIRKHRPDAEFLISAECAWLDGFERVGGMPYVDWFGGSFMNYSGDQGRKLGWLIDKHKKRMWVIAGSFSRDTTFSRLRGGTIHATYSAHHNFINSFFLHRAQVTMDYRTLPTGYNWMEVHDTYNLLEPDTTLSTALTLHAIAGQVLAGSQPDPEPLETTVKHGGYLWAYRDGRSGRPAVCFFPGEARSVTIGLEPKNLRLVDQLGNPMELAAVPGGKSRFQCEANKYYFLYGIEVEPAAFRETVRRAETDLPELPATESFAYYAADPEQTVRIEVLHVNRGQEPWTGHFRAPAFTAGPIPSERSLKEQINPAFPYREDRPLPAQPLPPQQGRSFVWLNTARPLSKPPVLDGDFGEWGKTASSALYYSMQVLGSVDMETIHSWKDSYKITCDYGMDYRVEWWAGYDAENLYLCGRVFDDQLVAADHPAGGREPDCLELRFDRDIAGDLVRPDPADDLSVWLVPATTGGRELRLEISAADGSNRRTLEGGRGTVKIWNDPALLKGWEPWPHPGPAVGYLIEAALPWKSLGLDSKPGAIIGFDLFGHETDIEPNGKPAASVLRWAGQSNPGGQLRLGTGRP
ncbi:MAG: hypothetical protein BWY73_00321 [candidate division TA06 bacterium ADurb.Bin417]|uniref:Carbohydrate-binding domain-containing protein n=1 Tax=candidate division TA06 bacterium ADurb.Bin417 TaxID=1852828 RepID=A0A1V5MKU1_UNCT6|nr:MAG: hypothetical protein BWY73_00321 [candidate division TA06 bacterium ADurb.Bin417]